MLCSMEKKLALYQKVGAKWLPLDLTLVICQHLTSLKIEYKLILAALIDSEQMLMSIEAQLCTRIATDEGLRGRNVLHSLCVHSCASMLNICSESLKMLFCLCCRGRAGGCRH